MPVKLLNLVICTAHTLVDVTKQTVTLEVTGSEEKVEKLVNGLQSFGIREVARTGRVAMTRGEQGI